MLIPVQGGNLLTKGDSLGANRKAQILAMISSPLPSRTWLPSIEPLLPVLVLLALVNISHAISFWLSSCIYRLWSHGSLAGMAESGSHLLYTTFKS